MPLPFYILSLLWHLPVQGSTHQWVLLPALEKKEDRNENTRDVRCVVCVLPLFLPRPAGGDALALTLQTEHRAQVQGQYLSTCSRWVSQCCVHQVWCGALAGWWPFFLLFLKKTTNVCQRKSPSSLCWRACDIHLPFPLELFNCRNVRWRFCALSFFLF